MKTLNKISTGIFFQLIGKMQGQDYLKIEKENFMPLVIEKLAESINTYWGKAIVYSLSHFYTQNGDLMYDPEMTFIVADNRSEDKKDLENIKIVPCSFQQANLGIYQESIFFKGVEMDKYNKQLQYDHTEFANLWLVNIQHYFNAQP